MSKNTTEFMPGDIVKLTTEVNLTYRAVNANFGDLLVVGYPEVYHHTLYNFRGERFYVEYKEVRLGQEEIYTIQQFGGNWFRIATVSEIAVWRVKNGV